MIEPKAAPPMERFKTFGILREANVFSCLYIKPFLATTQVDRVEFSRILLNFRPNSCCVGLLYRRRKAGTQSPFIHPAYSDLTSSQKELEKIVHFRQRLADSGFGPIFHSSICVSAYARNWFPTPEYGRITPSCA